MTLDPHMRDGLISLLEDLRAAGGIPVDAWLARVRAGDASIADDLYFAFIPTGELQDLAIAAGWGQRFLDLAARFDRLCPGIEQRRIAEQQARAEEMRQEPAIGTPRAQYPPPLRGVPGGPTTPCTACGGCGYQRCTCDENCLRYPPPSANDDLVRCWICEAGWVRCAVCDGTGVK